MATANPTGDPNDTVPTSHPQQTWRTAKPEDEESRDSRKMDPEILALQRIGRLLDEFEDGPRQRMMAYLINRYAPGVTKLLGGPLMHKEVQ